ncbi:MAG TPA: hypothetical protein DGH68_08995, partial [Bacteroidetes bacterium]|nr:hypothetical protein [Bacteroidota bacterium]
TITAAVADLNLRGTSGFTNFLFVDTSFATETYPIIVNVTNVTKPTATSAVTFKPNTGVTATISGAAASTQIFRILTSYVNFDGSNSGGSTRDLTIANTSTTTPQVIVIGSLGTTPITNCTVKNCNIINGINSSSALIVSDGTTPGTAGWFNNITIQNNTIQKAYIANYNIAVVSAGNGTGLNITGNDLTTAGANSVRLVGVYVQGVEGATVSNNNIGNFTTLDASNITGIWFATGATNSTISNNSIGPISSTTGPPRGIAVSSAVTNANVQLVGNTVSGLATSYSSPPYGIYVFSTTTGVTVERNKVSSIYNTNTGGYGARAILINTGLAASSITVKNNFVWDVKATSDVSTTYWGIGIGVEGATGGVGIYYNNVNLYGSLAGYTTATVHTAFGVLTSTAGPLDVRDNIFVNSFDNTTQTTDKSYAINSQAPNTAFTNINNNDYFVGGPAGVLGYLGADQMTLAAWQTATGRDTNSVSGTPFFRDSTNLHIDSTQTPLVVSNAGTPIAGITSDIDGQTRNVLTPDIGADEFALATVALSGTYTVGAGGQFATIPDAFAALQNYGVSGPVTLLLTNSQYDASGFGMTRDGHFAPIPPRAMVDPLDPLYRGESQPVQTDNPDTVGALTLLGPITGASSTNRITIRPATGSAVTINGNGGWVLNLLNASYVTVDGISLTGATSLTINSTAPASVGLLLEGNSDNNIIQNVTVRAPFGTSTAGTTALYLYADSATATPDNNVIQNNVIASGTDGVVILGNTTSFPNANSISNNMIGTATDSIGETGVYVQQANNTLINGNKIQNVRQVFTNVAGIWVATKHLGTKIWDNVIYNVKITSTTTAAGFASGFYIFGTATDTTNGDYYNNMIYDLDYLGTFTGGTVRGMYVSTGRLDTIAYNSIYLTGTATTNVTSGALYTSTHIGQVFRNNIAINARTETGTGRGIAFYKASTTSTISSNYNDLYVPTQPLSYIGGVGAANDTTLARWRARGYDSLGISTTANFQAPYLHINPTLPTPLDAGGIPVAGIATDFDGQARNGTTPDIGADEFVVGVFPPPVITLVARSSRVPNAGDTLAVTCTITDTVGIATANLLYSVDSVAQTPIAMTRTSGTPQSGTYRGVLPGSANLNGKRIEYRIQANSSSGQSTTTAITANNSYFAGISPLSLSGVKAIASNGQNLFVNYYAKVTGVVSGPNFQAGNVNLSYYFQDAVGGINLFMFGSAVPVLALGDSIIVIGKIAQFRGTTEITPDATTDITIATSGRTVTPIQLTLGQLNANPELYESRLIRLTSLQRVRGTPPWPPVSTNASIVMFQNVLADSIIMFLDLDTEIPGSPEPIYPVTVTGVTGQFTTSTTIYNNGYEIIPRYLRDFAGGPYDNFEAYTVGQRLACQNPIDWTTWSILPCDATEDPFISSAFAFSGTKSVVIAQNNDLVRRHGNDTTGIHVITFKFYIPSSKAGYFNTLAGFTPNAYNWGMEAYFDSAASGNNGRLQAGSSTTVPFAYTHNAWQTARVVVNLNIDSARFVINGNVVRTWRWTAGASGAGSPRRLAANDFFGNTAWDQMYMDDYDYHRDTVWTGVKEQSQEIPETFALEQNYPNPFNPTTTLRYALPKDAHVSLSIYNILGQRIATLKDEVQSVGYHDVIWNGKNDVGSQVASGVYFYRIEARPVDSGDAFTSIKKMMFLK